ncbi:glutathione S-transferase [Hortaea werneckii]|nr:glutathione S-transferase [Hortaea werneckii]KAI7301885.1 glutathione S-transferase [Hortaea werneckii]
MEPLTLHAHTTGPNPYKVAILLEALELPYNLKLWTFGTDAHGVKGAEYRSINPNGRVPALQDPNTGIVSWESMACLNYLLRVYDIGNKFGASSEEGEKGKVEMDQWISFLVSTMGPMIGQCNWFRHYNATSNEDAYKRYEAQAYRCLDVLEEQLMSDDRKWIITGDTFTAVDMHFEPWIRQTGYAGLTLDAYPMVKAWLERVQAVPALVRAYEKVKAGQQM